MTIIVPHFYGGPSVAAIERTVDPAVQPVSLAEVKAQPRIDSADDDALLNGYLAAAVDLIDGEGLLGRAMITQTWAQWVSQSPGRVRLLMGPFQALVSVEYYDADGATQTANIADFEVRKAGDFVTVEPKANRAWPGAQARPDAIKITYRVGYGDTAANVPEGLRHAILMLVAHWYEHRAAASELNLKDAPFGVDLLIGRHRVGWYG